jgi:hypothetical protein
MARRVIRVPVKLTSKVKAGSLRTRCPLCGRLIQPRTTHNCSKTV